MIKIMNENNEKIHENNENNAKENFLTEIKKKLLKM